MSEAVNRSESRRRRVAELRRARPRDPVLRGSLLLAISGVAYVWLLSGLDFGSLLEPRRLRNLERFALEVLPYPLRRGEGLGALPTWLWQRSMTAGPALWSTFLLSVAAIVPAAIVAAFTALGASRRLAVPEPFTPSRPRGSANPARRGSALGWSVQRGIIRGLWTLGRAIPEYIWAFFLVALFGPSAWPLILALAIHNAGILGRLGSEVVDDLDPAPAEALRALGAGRRQIAWVAVLPRALGRWLLFFFYRWETCVREATVLGMLGVASLGYWIEDARARGFLDHMLFLMSLAAGLVVLGDWLSDRIRLTLDADGTRPMKSR